MSVERWQQIKSIVAVAMETSGPERTDMVHSACGSDAELRNEVESLLAAADEADSFPKARAAIASAATSLVADQDAALRALLEGVLGHQYEIIRPLGRGGMGCVFLARERALERFVAIKVLRPDLALTEGHRERFRREARIAARLSHPGILGLHSFGEIDNLWYFVMTYVRGETLAERIRREGFLPWAEAHRIFSQMADALECAHKNGVVHRDIKPANILLDSESGQAVLADFGISKMPGTADSLTATGAIVGTPDFMSPEQVTGAADVDERSDIYSLGAVAYVMLTGREPFRSESGGVAMYRRVVEDPPPVDTLVTSVPPDLSAVVRRCMRRERTERWPNARSLKEALETILAADRLPDVVRDLPSFGPYAFLWAAGWSAFALLSDRSVSERLLLMMVALIVPFGLVLHVWNGAARGMRFVELARVALWPPEWWGMWWPRALRRPSDLWDRLPLMAKAVRFLLIAACPLLLFVILFRDGITSVAVARWVEPIEWGIFVGGIVVVAAGFVWTRRMGLGVDQSFRFLFGPTLASSAWNDPALARLLAPAWGKVREPERDTPADYLRAIRELLPQLPASGGDSALRAAAAADRVFKAIDKCDRELASIARDAGPGEADRLVFQLDSLDSGDTAETGERAELRGLIRHQLDLVRRMQSRREIVLRERSHLMDLLRGLWALVKSGSDSQSGDDGAGRLQALCAEIRAELGSES